MFKTFIVFILVILYTKAQVLRNEGDAARALKASSGVDLEKLRSLLTEEAKQDLTSRAEAALNSGLLGADQQDEYNVSSTCMDDTETLFMALSAGEDWAVRMIDAMGKPPSGLKNYHFRWLGSYDECLAVQAQANISGEIVQPFTGRYCTANISPQQEGAAAATLSIGLCVPNSCNSNDTTKLAQTSVPCGYWLQSIASLYEPAHEITVLVGLSCNEGSDELAKMCMLVRAHPKDKGEVRSILEKEFDPQHLQKISVGPSVAPVINYALTINPPGAVLVSTQGKKQKVFEETKFGLVRAFAASKHKVLGLLPLNATFLPKPLVTCQEGNGDLNTKAIVTIVICSIFGLLMAVATVYDIILVNLWTRRTIKEPKYEILKEDRDKLTSFNDECEKLTSFTDHKEYGTNNSLKPSDEKSITPPTVVISNVDTMKVGRDTSLEQTMEDQIPRPGGLGKVLLSFSIYSNGAKILNTKQPSGTLTAVNGIRFISMSWVILGHSFQSSMVIADNMATYGPKMFKRFTFQAIINGTVSVDTFFTLSGLLVAYLSLKEIKKREGVKKFNWLMFYFHRFWRLTPPYMLFLMFYVCLMKYWSDGPMWPQGLDVDDCSNSWWRNLLYVNNLVEPKQMCMAWSWYLANDMQFYILSPLMLIPLYYSSVIGSLACLTFLLVSIISTAVISSANNFTTNAGAEGFFDKIYITPWCRIGPYAVGFFVGYLLYKTDCKLKIPKVFNLLGWIAATGIALSVLYGLYDSSGESHLSVRVSAFYNSTFRSAWGLAVCWVILSCATGHGGFVNTLLSWKALIPLSRLTYCAYLVHPTVTYTYVLSKRSLVYFTDLEQTFLFAGVLVMSYAAAFIVSLTFESPMMGLEKALLGRGKNS